MLLRKGIILAGGSGTRLFPVTKSTSKHLLPIYDKPMIFYSLSTLMLADINEIALIVKSIDLENYKRLLKDGSEYGLKITYIVQDNPNGLPEAYILCKDFLSGSPSCLILGDNFFYGSGLKGTLEKCSFSVNNTILIKKVINPSQYGIANINSQGKIISLVEKPDNSTSNLAVTGLYFLDKEAPLIASLLKPSKRNEIEIIDLLKNYLNKKKLTFIELPRGTCWFDMGTVDDMLMASQFVSVVQNRQNILIADLVEIAKNKKWI